MRLTWRITELITGLKTTDPGVKTAMLKALFEVVRKAGASMSEASRNSILALIDTDSGDSDGMVSHSDRKDTADCFC